jgi:hypothetical protein
MPRTPGVAHADNTPLAMILSNPSHTLILCQRGKMTYY